jgi:hypothetical protein
MQRSIQLAAVLVLHFAACGKSSSSSPSATASSSNATTTQAQPNTPTGTDLTFTVDPAQEPTKNISIKAGQGFELIFPGNPSETWREVGNSRMLGPPVDDIRVGARGFQWDAKATKLASGDIELHFESEGNNKRTVTVIVHVK